MFFILLMEKYMRLSKICILIIFFVFNSSVVLSDYENTNGKPIEKSFQDLLKWATDDIETKIDYIEISNDWESLDFEEDDNYGVWVGHSTFLIKKNGITILTDPVFSDRASPFKNIGPKRLIPPAIPLKKLPEIDFITISHNHYDHLDIRSLKDLYTLNSNTIFLVPAGDKKLLERQKIKNVYEYEWWEGYLSDELKITFHSRSALVKERSI